MKVFLQYFTYTDVSAAKMGISPPDIAITLSRADETLLLRTCMHLGTLSLENEHFLVNVIILL